MGLELKYQKTLGKGLELMVQVMELVDDGVVTRRRWLSSDPDRGNVMGTGENKKQVQKK